MAIRSLYEVEAFSPLEEAARECRVDFTLFGSVASRVVLNDLLASEARPDLFALCEHSSDIDLAHSGPPEMNGRVYAAIERVMPLAPWFRWSIIDRAAFDRFQAQSKFNADIPLRRISLGRWLDVPEGVLDDAREGRARFRRNPDFAASPRAREQSDTEAAAALLYIDAALDLLQLRERAGGGGVSTDAEIVRDIMGESISRLAELETADRLRALRRLWYRTSATAVRMTPEFWQITIKYFGLEPLLEALRQSPYQGAVDRLEKAGSGPVAISSALPKGFRLDPDPDAYVDTEGPAAEILDGILRDLAGVEDRDEVEARGEMEPYRPESDEQGPYRLEPGNFVVAAIRNLELHEGAAPSSRDVGPLRQDFVYLSFAVETPILHRQSAADLAVLVLGRREGPRERGGGMALLPVNASASRSADSGGPAPRFTIRVNLGGFGNGWIDKLDLFLTRREQSDG